MFPFTGRGEAPSQFSKAMGPETKVGKALPYSFGVGPRPPPPPPPPPHRPTPPPPSFQHYTPPRSPRSPEAVQEVWAPGYRSPGLAPNPYPSAAMTSMPEPPQAVRSPAPTLSAASGSYQSVRARRPGGSPPRWVSDTQTNPRPSAVTSIVASRNSGTSVTARIARSQDPKRTRSPPSYSMSEDVSGNSNQTLPQRSSDLHIGNGVVAPRARAPQLPFENNYLAEHVQPAIGEGQWPGFSQRAWDGLPKLPGNYPRAPTPQEQSSIFPYNTQRSFINETVDVHASKRVRSPPIEPANEVLKDCIPFVQRETKRASLSPPASHTRSNALFTESDSQNPQRPLPSVNTAPLASFTRASASLVTKRSRSPPLASSGIVVKGNSYSTQDATERELHAKAMRLARFKGELSDNLDAAADQKVLASRHEQSMVERQKFAGSGDSAGGFSNCNASSDFEGLETPSIIIGLCPDMCPELERAERERKGDLDQYERLDGDRNQTNTFLAVKKYNRTAEREASLIRPMSVLQKTFDYLLSLLEQPYDERFLGMYNFLWDRMRAIRMDLRMQHIFNQEAITMLEQMIRLHIIAMHELCEYTKGEGFSEGFDAHLNIEQMNKTSVELFHIYDDHRKKGINLPTEKEFRGYYALLKLDKHPGYKVEPAELSLDLAKMTPEIRQTPEVRFARDVARACRTGNFIAFFRLARKASYLQACLMHAHFAKLRTQALAFLHSGLQNNQGLPVAHVAKWLVMEEEDIEGLFEYHGFLTKEFEEPYLVKEGLFLNSGKDYPTKCSKLVHKKKSMTIVDDVLSTSPAEATKEIKLPNIYEHNTVPSALQDRSPVPEVDEKMPDFEVVSSPYEKRVASPPEAGSGFQSKMNLSIVSPSSRDDQVMVDRTLSPWGFLMANSSPKPSPAKLGAVDKPNHDSIVQPSPDRTMVSAMEVVPSQVVPDINMLERSSSGKYAFSVNDPLVVDSNMRDDNPPDIDQPNEDNKMEIFEDEVFQAKLKLIIRLWLRRSIKLRELREQRQMAADAALSSLSLGPPIRKTTDRPSGASEFEIDQVVRERCKKHERSWSRLNVSDLIADTLVGRNPDAKCLCWKIVLCSQINEGDKVGQRDQVMDVASSTWLFSKLMPARGDDDDDDDDLLVSSSGLSIWRKWIPSQSSNGLICCLSVVKRVNFDNLDETVAGASAIIFLVSQNVPWNVQKVQLHNLVHSIPSDSFLPLLVLSSSFNTEVSDPSSIIIRELGLKDFENSRISNFTVIFLVGDKQMGYVSGFLSDKQLREGLQWLASESPLQPELHYTKTRDLVLSHLNSSLDMLSERNEYEVGPNQCISAFNNALDCSMGEIDAAVKAYPSGWPCPDIALLEDFSDEHMVMRYLPSIGWSSRARIESVLSAVRSCQLPSFSNSLSWLGEGAGMNDEIENLKTQLESSLIEYLTESSGIMGYLLATKEGYVMVQKSARLELHGARYYIIPNWTMICRRIFNWRLTVLSSGAVSSAYVLRHHHVDPTSQILDKSGFQRGSYTSQPPLDEIIGIGCNSVLSGVSQPQPAAFLAPPKLFSNGDAPVAANINWSTEDERASPHELVPAGGLNAIGTKTLVAGKATKQPDKLTTLLEKCNSVQNSIEKRLYIFF